MCVSFAVRSIHIIIQHGISDNLIMYFVVKICFYSGSELPVLCIMSKGLKLLSHNIQGGIEKKVLFDDVLSSLEFYDVAFLQETWLVDSSQLNVNGFSILRSDRGSHKKKHTGSGGVVTLYKTHLSKGLHKIPSKHKDFMWVKFDKNYFNISNDLYIVNCYIPPEDSVVHMCFNPVH